MDGRTFPVFVVGLLVGAAVGWVAHRLLSKPTYETKGWNITDACTRSDGKIQISVTVPDSTEDLVFVRFHSDIFDTTPNPIPGAPGAGAVPSGTTSPIIRPHPAGGLQGSSDCVVVWAEFRAYQARHLPTDLAACSEGERSRLHPGRIVSLASAEQLEAIPRTCRVSLESPGLADEGLSPGVRAVRLQAAETLLHYVPEASRPTDPCWQARSEAGLVPEWTLRLLHRPNGFGALLSVVGSIEGREVRLNWVTSNWQFHATNRLVAESKEAHGLVLLVRPA